MTETDCSDVEPVPSPTVPPVGAASKACNPGGQPGVGQPKPALSPERLAHMAAMRAKAAVVRKERALERKRQLAAEEVRRHDQAVAQAQPTKRTTPTKKVARPAPPESDSESETESSSSSSSSESESDAPAPRHQPRRKGAAIVVRGRNPSGASMERKVAQLERQLLKMKYKSRYQAAAGAAAASAPAAAPPPPPVVIHTGPSRSAAEERLSAAAGEQLRSLDGPKERKGAGRRGYVPGLPLF